MNFVLRENRIRKNRGRKLLHPPLRWGRLFSVSFPSLFHGTAAGRTKRDLPTLADPGVPPTTAEPRPRYEDNCRAARGLRGRSTALEADPDRSQGCTRCSGDFLTPPTITDT